MRMKLFEETAHLKIFFCEEKEISSKDRCLAFYSTNVNLLSTLMLLFKEIGKSSPLTQITLCVLHGVEKRSWLRNKLFEWQQALMLCSIVKMPTTKQRRKLSDILFFLLPFVPSSLSRLSRRNDEREWQIIQTYLIWEKLDATLHHEIIMKIFLYRLFLPD